MPKSNLRSIKKAYDEVTDKAYDAESLLKGREEAFKVRGIFARDGIKPVCTECFQPLMISHRKKHLFLSHKPKSKPCDLKSGVWSKKEEASYYKAIANREGPRHKELKNKIGDKLSRVDGIEVDSITIDNKFIIKEDGKRRPDVYCRYKGKELVFEIQISHLSLRYILGRHDFYKRHGIYLIWVLDDIDVKDQDSFELDIKYLTSYQNFFSLNVSSDDFNLRCRYKRVRTDDLVVKSKWREKNISLSELKFDFHKYEVYWYDYGYQEQLAKDKLPELRRIREEKDKKEAERIEAQRKKGIVEQFRKELLEVWKEGSHPYYPLDHFFNYRFDNEQLKYLNSLLKLNTENKRFNGESLLIHCVLNRDDSEFLDIIFFSEFIELDVNDVGKSNVTLFQAFYDKRVKLNEEGYRWTLFNRGYKLKDSDISFLRKEVLKYFNEKDYERKLLLLKSYESLSGYGDDLMSTAFENTELLCTLYSAKFDKPFGWRIDFKQLVDVIIKSYPTYWPLVRVAYEHFHGIWERVINNDRTRMVRDNLEKFERTSCVLDKFVLSLVVTLYPELEEAVNDLRKKYRVTE